MRAVLVGNQNCGKSTLFNLLTGSNQKIGNWPGVTVSKKSGVISDLEMELIDLPGIYSLVPYTLEEKITSGYLFNEEYDLIINVVDATSLERGLYLTTQLLELHKNIIVVLNMMDKLEEKGTIVDTKKLGDSINVDICIISATRGKGIVDLLKSIKKNIFNKKSIISIHNDFSDEKKIVQRYTFIDQLCRSCVKENKKKKSSNELLDKIVLNKLLSIPIFITIIFGMYYIAIDLFGNTFSLHINNLINDIRNNVSDVCYSFNVSEWIVSLLCNGIITGVGSILGFLPQLCVIFFITSFLEASGYMSRVSFIFDKLLKKCGLNGKSLIPFILGTGCSVSGIISTKIIENKNERINTVITNSFIPCSAKLPIITLFSRYFFENNYAIVATSFYFISILIVVVSSLIIKKLFGKKYEELYIFEMPQYKFPNIKFLYKDIKDKIIDFIRKAGTTIFLASIFIWILLSFFTYFEYGVSINESILAFCGEKISWILKPIIGVNSWQATVSAIQGIIAKEQIISSMEIISGLSGEFKNVYDIFSYGSPFDFFNKASAYAFVAFNLFTTPCIVAIITMCKELKKFRYCIFAICYQFLVGWTVAALIFSCFGIWTAH